MTKARDIADLGGVTTRLDQVGNSDGALSNRNMVINGAMQVAQRGTSITVSNNNWLYTLDRFQFDENGSTSAVLDVTQSTDAPDGFGYSLKMTATTADAALASSDGLRLQHRIEAQDLQSLSHGTSNAKPITLSFWVKSKTTGTNGIWVYKSDSSRQTSFSYTINAADTWEYKTITIPADTAGAINNDNGEGLRISWYLAAGTDFNSGTLDSSWASLTSANRAVGQVNNFSSTSDYWAITGVQLELGDTSTDFEHISFGDQLQKCQRYYYQKDYTINTYEPIKFPCWFGSTQTLTGEWVHPVTMRVPPTFSHNGVGNFRLNDSRGNDQVCDSITRTGGNVNETWLTFGGVNTSFTIGYCGYLNTQVANDAQITFDAEL